MTNPMENLLKSQLDQSRESAKLYKQTAINMARASIKQLPREDLIDILVKKKIIMKDWEQKGNKFKLREDED